MHEGLKYDVLLGRDFPYLWEVGFREVNLATCAMVKTRQVTKQESVLKLDKPGKVVTGDDLTEHELKEANDSITENEYSEIVVVSDDDVCQESSEKLDDNSSGNTDYNEFCLKPQHTIAKTTKTKLTRAEKRASKQAHAALVSLPKLLDHSIDEMIQDQHKDKALDALWSEAREKGEKYTEKQ